MKVETKKIDKHYAEYLLSINKSNRPLNDRNVDYLVEEMKNNRFKLNGDAIRISKSNILLDGQHRLAACIKSGISFESIVISDLDDDIFLTIDQGRKRTSGDVLHINGYKNYNLLAATTIRCLAYKKIKVPFHSRIRLPPSKDEILNFIKDNDDIIFACDFAKKSEAKKMINISLLAFSFFTAYSIDKNLAINFFSKLSNGNDIKESSPLYVLRKKLISNLSSTAKDPDINIAAYISMSWNAERTGNKIKILRYNSSEQKFPVFI